MPQKMNVISAHRRQSSTANSIGRSRAVISAKKRASSGPMRAARSRKFEIPAELVQAAQTNRLALFIGAGVSKQVDAKLFPNWSELLTYFNIRALKLGIFTPEQHNALNQMIRTGDYLMAGQILKDNLSKTQFQTFLKEKCQPAGIQPSQLHKRLFDLNPAIVLTTNYDTLLEDAYIEVAKRRDVTFTYERSTDAHHYLSGRNPDDPPLIFKVHGCVRNSGEPIISEFDYRKLIYRNPGYRTLLSSIFVNYRVLLLGYSLSDREIILTLESLQDSFDYAKKSDYIFLSAKGRSIFDSKKLASNFGVQPIWYNPIRQHREVYYFVNQFAKIIKSN